MRNISLSTIQDWDIKRLYYARHDKGDMDELGAQLVEDLDDFLGQCDVVTINLPLTDKTKHMFNKEVLGKMKKGAFLINNARGSIVDPQAIVEACESGQLAGEHDRSTGVVWLQGSWQVAGGRWQRACAMEPPCVDFIICWYHLCTAATTFAH